MPKTCYEAKVFTDKHLVIIRQANEIIESYQERGFVLTLRQLYYQFVARGLIPNKDTEYKRLGSIVADARLAGLIDWEAMTDRTRFLRKQAEWVDPAQIISSCASQFRVDRWENQARRIEVWIEKDALIGVIEPVCKELRVPCFSCRGYVSLSEMWVAANRIRGYIREGKLPVILHLGDHDPSGVDMTRDIGDRLETFLKGHGFEDHLTIDRLALTMEQVRQYNPPPNPAKITDSRCNGYISRFGNESWELDALDPDVMADLIRQAVISRRNEKKWKASGSEEAAMRDGLKQCSDRWVEVEHFIRGSDGEED